MFIEERHNNIVQLINKNKSLSVTDLTKKLNFSPATIRSDLNYLDQQGLIVRTHGGATALKNNNNEKKLDTNFKTREQKNHAEKVKLAQEAFNYIEEDSSIVLDASSTTYELAKIINESSYRLLVITNGLNIAQLLQNNSNITTILIGGVVRGDSNAVEGTLGAFILENTHIDAGFFSAHAFNLDEGLTDFNIYEVELKKEMVTNSNTVYTLIDHSKLDKQSISSFAKSDEIDYFLTDKKADKEIIDKYKDNGINIL